MGRTLINLWYALALVRLHIGFIITSPIHRLYDDVGSFKVSSLVGVIHIFKAGKGLVALL